MTNVETHVIEKRKDSTKTNTEENKDRATRTEDKVIDVNNTGIVVEGSKVIDHDKKTITEKPERTKRISIREIPLNTTTVPQNSPTKSEERNSDNQGDNKSQDNKDKKDTSASTSQGTGERRPSCEFVSF